MTPITDDWVVPGLVLLADWSVRWGVVLVVLAAWFAVRPPQRAATRYALCSAALVAGLLIPVVPRWGNVSLSWTVAAAKEARPLVERQSPGREPGNTLLKPEGESWASDEKTMRPPSVASDVVDRSTPVPLGPWRLAALVVALAWVCGLLVLIIRVAGGWLVLMRLNREAVDLDWRSDELFFECQRCGRADASGQTRDAPRDRLSRGDRGHPAVHPRSARLGRLASGTPSRLSVARAGASGPRG